MFRTDISQQDWTYSGSNYQTLRGLTEKLHFFYIANLHPPLRTRRVRLNESPWINSELKKGIRDCNAAIRKANRSSDPRDWAHYKSC